MAEVFLARSIGPGGIEKRVCVKRVLPGLAVDPRAAGRFATEARTALALQHANIVPVFDFGRDGQDLFLVMEWIEGCDLAALMAATTRREAGLLPATVAAYVAAEIAKALGYLHERLVGGQPAGLVHRDLTPRNVLLSRLGEVRLADFGVARAFGGPGAPAGTPRYMAPEQARGEPPHARDDLFALGLVLAEMCLGEPVRRENTVAAAQRPPELPPAPEDASQPLRRITERLLGLGAEPRYQRAADAQADLARVLADAVLRGERSPAEQLGARVAATAEELLPAGAPAPVASLATMAAETIDAAAKNRPRRMPVRIALAVVLVAAAAALGVVARGRSARTPAIVTTTGPVAAPLQPATPRTATAAIETPAPPPSHPAPAAARPRRPAELRVLAPGSWVAVYLDGRKLADDAGVFAIAPGRHQLRVENPPLGFVHTEAINVREGERLERSYHPETK
jgi:hypothetical protein